MHKMHQQNFTKASFTAWFKVRIFLPQVRSVWFSNCYWQPCKPVLPIAIKLATIFAMDLKKLKTLFSREKTGHVDLKKQNA